MGLRAVVLLSALTLACASSIQNPHIHDSVEDQIAMESGSHRTVVTPPAALLERASASTTTSTSAKPTSTTAKPKTTASGQKATKPQPTRRKQPPSNLFDIISAGEPTSAPPSTERPLTGRRPQYQPGYPGLGAWRRPAPQMLDLPPRFGQFSQYGGLGGLGAALGGYGGRTVILLQPIYMPVPVRAPADDDQALAADSSQQERDQFFRKQAERRPISLLDILQQGYYF